MRWSASSISFPLIFRIDYKLNEKDNKMGNFWDVELLLMRTIVKEIESLFPKTAGSKKYLTYLLSQVVKHVR